MSELESAVERWRHGVYHGDGGNLMDGKADRKRDAFTLADAYIAHLDRQQAEARERELPVDAEWLESIGFVSVPSKRGPEYADHLELGRLNIWELSGEWLMTEADRFGFRVRGQILDLLSALKIPTKGQS